MASFPLIGSQGSVVSWGATGTASNFYADLLSSITPASARWTISGDVHDVTGMGTYAVAKIPGLKSATAVISGFGGNAAGAVTPYVGNRGTLSFSAGGYALHIQSWEWTARTLAVHDITSTTQATPVLWRYFRPDIFTHSCRFTALVDDTTSLVNLPDVGASLPTVTLTYGSSQTIAVTGILRMVDCTVAKGNKQLVTYEIDGTSTAAMSGGFLSGLGTSDTWGGSANLTPFWTAGSASIEGQLIINNTSTGPKRVTFADSFWTSIRVAVSPGAPVGVQIGVQATGVVTIA